MARTDKFRKQHEEILTIARSIAALLGDQISADDAQTARHLLLQMSGKVAIHLAMEDKSFYPNLLASTDSEIRSKARQYMDEMGLLASTFNSYLQKWKTPTLIMENGPAFTAETKVVFNALSKRIQKENTQLYALVDAMG